MDFQQISRKTHFSFVTSSVVILRRPRHCFVTQPASSRRLTITRPRTSPVAVVYRLRSSAIGRVLPLLAQRWQLRGQKRSISELLDSVAVAMVACVATFFFPFLPSPIANFLRILALAWPVLGPYAQATVRNARFRLQAGGRGGARVVCGHAWVDAHSIVHVDDGEVCVEIRAPSKTLSLPAQPACALVVGISVVDVLFSRSGRSLMRSPFVNLKSFRNACAQCAQAWDEKDGDEHTTWNVSD